MTIRLGGRDRALVLMLRGAHVPAFVVVARVWA